MFPFGGNAGPFGNMQSMMNGMMSQMMQDPFHQNFQRQMQGGFPPQHQAGFGFPMQHQQQLHHHPESTHIEDVTDQMQGMQAQYARMQRHNPIVEEPDEGNHRRAAPARRPRESSPHPYPPQASQQRQQQHSSNSGGPHAYSYSSSSNGPNGHSFSSNTGPGGYSYSSTNNPNGFSYSSSSYSSSSGGPGGMNYQSSSSSRESNGVREAHTSFKDGRTGKESVTVSRGMGNKESVVSRTRDASGRESTDTQLRGIPDSGAAAYEAEWRAQAQNSLYGGTGAGPAVGLPQWQQQQQQQAQAQQPQHQATRFALPSSGMASASQSAPLRTRNQGDRQM